MAEGAFRGTAHMEIELETALRPPHGSRPEQGGVRRAQAPAHAREDPGLPQQAAREFRDRRPDLPLGARGAAATACALHRRRDARGVCAVDHLRAERDYDHVVALFRRGRLWGAISKTNPALLRWRDPVYRSLRELAMSYLHEYANKRHQKTLRSYAGPFDLRRFDPALWITNKKNCWEIGATLDDMRHRLLLTRKQARD